MIEAAAARAYRPDFAAWWTNFVDLGHHIEVGNGVLNVISKPLSNVEGGINANIITVSDGSFFLQALDNQN